MEVKIIKFRSGVFIYFLFFLFYFILSFRFLEIGQKKKFNPGRMMQSGATPATPSLETSLFEFDLNGYCVLRGIISAEEVEEMNAAITAHADDVSTRPEALRNTSVGSSLWAANGRQDLGGMLGWEDGDSFRNLLAHPKIVPYLEALLGEGYRLDHWYILMMKYTLIPKLAIQIAF